MLPKLNFSLVATKKLKLLLQEELADCGLACIAMLANYFGHELSLPELRRHYPDIQRGMNVLRIKQILEELGFMVRAVRIEPAAIQALPRPCILHWEANHFVLLSKLRAKYVEIYDPKRGVRRCSYSELRAAMTGAVLTVEKGLDWQPIRAKASLNLLTWFKSLKCSAKFWLYLFFLSFVVEGLGLLQPLLIQYVSDRVLQSSSLSNLLLLAGGFTLIALVQAFSYFIRGRASLFLNYQLLEQFSSNLMQHLLRLPLAFFERRQKGDIVSKFQFMGELPKKLGVDFIQAVFTAVLMLFNLLMMLLYSPSLTALVCLFLLVFIGLRGLSFYQLERQSAGSLQHHARALSLFLENIQMMSPIKVFMKQGIRFSLWRNAYTDALNADIQLANYSLIYETLQLLFSSLEYLLLVVLGAFLVLENYFSLGMLLAFLSYRLILVNKASSLIQLLFEYRLLKIPMQRLGDLVFQEPEPAVIDRPSALPGVESANACAISIKKLAFRYESTQPFLFENLDLEVAAGEKLVITGASGSGKSSLLKLILGLLPLTQGEICIEGLALAQFGLQRYRQMTAAVLQEDSLFAGSILENISFYDEQLDFSWMQEVAKMAAIHDLISSLPMAYETRLGEAGQGLSGGQRQRILLARALYKRPKILFLDESSSQLDVPTERRINQALKALNMTQIIIAHREETIRLADRVFVL